MSYYKAIICDRCNKIELVEPGFPKGNVTKKREELSQKGWKTVTTGKVIYDYCSNICEENINKKTLIVDFYNSLEISMSTRLRNVLLNLISNEEKGNASYNWKYIEDIDKKKFFYLENAGKKCWAEFEDLKKFIKKFK